MKMNGDEPDDSVSYEDYLATHSITNNDYLSARSDECGAPLARRLLTGAPSEPSFVCCAEIKKPILFLCSQGDKHYKFDQVMPMDVCKMIKHHDNAILCAVDRAGHGQMFEGVTCSNWAGRVAGEFVITLNEMRKEKEAAEGRAQPKLQAAKTASPSGTRAEKKKEKEKEKEGPKSAKKKGK
jgi:hypothetical protein